MAVLPDRALVISVALHGVLLMAAAANVDWRRQPRPAPAVSIKATVIDASVFEQMVVAPPEAAAQVDDGQRDAQRQQQERDAEQDAERVREEQQAAAAEAERQRNATQEAERKRQAEAAASKRKAEDEARRKQQADEEKRKREADEAERKRQAEEAARRKREAEEAERKRKADERAARERREREAQMIAQAERENLMREQMELETRRQTAVDSGQLAQYIALVQQQIQRNWIRPASAREGLECRVSVQQIPGGEVVSVKILRCNGDQAVEDSIVRAIRKASPLPKPADPTLFQRDLVIDFVPN